MEFEWFSKENGNGLIGLTRNIIPEKMWIWI